MLLQGEEESFCCRNGKIVLQPLQPLLASWPAMFRDRTFRQSSRKYNLFSFTAMGVSGEHGFVHQASPSCMKIHGRTYYRILTANLQGPVQWYVHDPQLARANEAHRLLLNVGCMTAIAQMLNQIDPYAHHLRALGQIPTAKASLHISWHDESSEIATTVHCGVGPEASSRTVVFWHGQPEGK